MNNENTKETCPVWIGYGLKSGIRKLIHNPKKILKKFIEPNMVVADIGTGMGFMTIPMAKMVGESGEVFAIDIQEKMLLEVKKTANKNNIGTRILPIKCKQESLMLEKHNDTIDFALMFMIVHEAKNKEKLLTDIFKALKPGGLLMISEPIIHVSKKCFDNTIEIATNIGFKVSNLKQTVAICRTIILQKKTF